MMDPRLSPRRAAGPVGIALSALASAAGAEPLPTRDLETVAQVSSAMTGDRGLAGSARAAALAGNRYLVEGFDVTDLRTGRLAMPIPLGALAAVEISGSATAAHAWAPGAVIEAVAVSGGNKHELEAGGSHGRELVRDPEADHGSAASSSNELAADASGPLARDRLWYATGGEGRWTRGRAVGPAGGSPASDERLAGLARLTWQAAPRHKLSLLAAASRRLRRFEPIADAPDPAMAAALEDSVLAGAVWEALATGNVFVRAQGAWRRHGRGRGGGPAAADAAARDALGGPQGAVRIEWFPRLGRSGDHHVALGARHETLAYEVGGAGLEARSRGHRTLVHASDQFRPARGLTVTPGLAFVDGAFATPEAPDTALASRGFSQSLGLAWDLTRDGRTVLRANAARITDAGSFAHARAAAVSPAPPGWSRTWELSAGAEREVVQGVAIAVDAVHRRRAGVLATDARKGAYRGLTLTARRREGSSRFAVSYTRQDTPGAPEVLRATATLRLRRWLSASGLLIHDSPLVWDPLRLGSIDGDEPAASPIAATSPTPPRAVWLAGARVLLGLVEVAGVRLTLWAEIVGRAGRAGAHLRF